MDLISCQISIFNKVKTGFGLLRNTITYHVSLEQFNNLSNEEKGDIIKQDTLQESLKMLIVNYLIALLGNKSNDKISLANNQLKGNEIIKDFYIKNGKIIDKLYGMRDKIYSHFDMGFCSIDFCTNEEIETCLKFLEKTMRILIKGEHKWNLDSKHSHINKKL